jgi:phenol hydroxylase P0 protein
MGKVISLNHSDNEATRYVRVTERDHRGYVEFQFSIGDPNLYLEMTLPPAAFDEFCAEHRVRVLSQHEREQVDANDRRWRFGDDEQE